MGEVTRREHVLRDVLGGIAIAAVLTAGSYFAGIWPWIGAQIEWLGEPTEITRWWYWFLLTFFVVTLLLLGVLVLVRLAVPEHNDYRKDVFFGLTWYWDWDGPNQIGELWCRCLICDRMLAYNHSQVYRGGGAVQVTMLGCQSCGEQLERDGSVEHLKGSVRREIDLKVRNGEWKAVVERMEKAKK